MIGTDMGDRSPSPLVLTKLAPPRIRLEHVDRRELRGRLAEGRQRLTLLNAPAGYGKTTLLAWWQQADARRPFAWVSLDAGDSDPLRFWSYVTEAIGRSAGAGSALLADPGAATVPGLINAIAALPRSVVLVLDDYHCLGDSQVHDQLALLLEQGPPNLRVVLATRSQPPLPLDRLRASLELDELTADELRFSREETAVLLNERLEPGLGDAEIDRLLARTDGWPAGLALSERHLLEYFSSEVLGSLPDNDRAALRRASLAPELSAPLLDAMLERDGSADLLHRLERSNLVVAHEQSYRLRAAFREPLHALLAEDEPELIPDLHLRASEWYAGQGAPAQAIEHALAAGRTDVAADLIAAEWQPFADVAHNTSFAGWLSALPEALIAADPRLALAAAWTTGWGGMPGSWRDWLDRVDPPREPVELPNGLPSVEAAVALTRAVYSYDDVAAHLDAAREAAVLFKDNPGLRTVADGSLGVALYHAGLLAEARAHLAANVDRLAAEFIPTLPLALAYLSLALTTAGEPEEGLRCAEKARERSDQTDVGHAGITGVVGLAMGAALRRLDRPDEALGELDQAVALLESDPLKVDLAQARIERALALYALRRRAAAVVELDQAAAVIDGCKDAGAVTFQLRGAVALTGAKRRRSRRDLSDRELEILRLLASDLTRREIGATLFVSFNTIQTHMRSIYRKLGVTSRVQAVARARERGLFEDG
jgi:LuxR family transcriptional regulator, maltose regulon positive regulatory protein